MATEVIMPALGMAQDTGTLIRWLKTEGEAVLEGEPIAEIQTDKATIELEARASGVLSGLRAQAGEEVPVGRVIASISQPGEQTTSHASAPDESQPAAVGNGDVTGRANGHPVAVVSDSGSAAMNVSPVALRIAVERGVDLRDLQMNGRRVQKADVLAYLASRGKQATVELPHDNSARLAPASPKARRLANERGISLASVPGSGPGGAILTRDLPSSTAAAQHDAPPAVSASLAREGTPPGVAEPLSAIWRIMAERVTHSWREIPHFFLLREVNATRMITWRESARRQFEANVTYTDLLVKAVAQTLRAYPRVNASWRDGNVIRHADINVGVAVATDEGLIVPVIHRADDMDLREITAARESLVKRGQAGKQRPEDLAGATFTISNLGMYGVDAFSAIVPGPQAAILAVGRIADRVASLRGAPAVVPMLTLSLSCDHRVLDGARGAQFLGALADLLEEPTALLG